MDIFPRESDLNQPIPRFLLPRPEGVDHPRHPQRPCEHRPDPHHRGFCLVLKSFPIPSRFRSSPNTSKPKKKRTCSMKWDAISIRVISIRPRSQSRRKNLPLSPLRPNEFPFAVSFKENRFFFRLLAPKIMGKTDY